jgi:DNA processing protein
MQDVCRGQLQNCARSGRTATGGADEPWYRQCTIRTTVSFRGQQDRAALLAAALLRYGHDTLAARLFKAHLGGGPGAADWRLAPEALAELLRLPEVERVPRLEEAREAAARAMARGAALGARIVTLPEPDYPPLLAQIIDPPIALWLRGNVEALARPAVALVGSRRAGPASLETARRLARALGEAGVVVISGLARGVDAAAHRGALESGGGTVAVLGSGLDITYPREHAGLAREVADQGCLVSELPPGTPPLAWHFPLRNRLISGLARAVVVVEASERSGSLITARMALEQGRDVLAVPGSVASGCHRGCHALIKDGARLVENVEDILEEVGWAPAGKAAFTQTCNVNRDNGLVAMMLQGEPVTADLLASRTGRAAPELLTELGRLEVEGRVGRIGSGFWVRLD